jgi:hypothetical protein
MKHFSNVRLYFLAERRGEKYKARERPWGRELLGAEYFAGGSILRKRNRTIKKRGAARGPSFIKL